MPTETVQTASLQQQTVVKTLRQCIRGDIKTLEVNGRKDGRNGEDNREKNRK